MLKTAQAAEYFKKGEYQDALCLYLELGELIGKHFFETNIKLIERRLGFKYSSSIREDKAESLIHIIRILANQKVEAIKAVVGRVVVVGSSPWCENQLGYSMRLHQMTNHLQSSGWEIIYMAGQFPVGETSATPEVSLIRSIKIFVERFKAISPQVVVAACDFNTALAAISAARQLSIPVIKEHLHYSDAFQEKQQQSLSSQMDFAQKFAAEKICLELSDGGYYIYPESETSLASMHEILCGVCGREPKEPPVATLQPKTYHTLNQKIDDKGGLHFLELDTEDAISGNPKGIVTNFQFYDIKDEKIKEKLPDFASSKTYFAYKYVDTSNSKSCKRVFIFNLPEGVYKVKVDIVANVTHHSITLHNAKIGKLKLEDVARWLSLKVCGMHWIETAEAFVHKEGAVSLHLALLYYKYLLYNRSQDLKKLKGKIQEMIELDPAWLPEQINTGKKLPIKSTDRLTVAHLHKTAYPYENTGGAIRCLNTVLSQQRIGINSYIITPIGYPRTAGFESARNHEVISGIEHFRIGANAGGTHGISLPDRTRYSTFQIAKLLKQNGADVIHAASGVRGYEIVLQALALKKITGLPIIYEVRSFHEHTWSIVRSDVMELEKTQLRLIKENFCMGEADYVTTISQSMKKILIERGLDSDKIEVIPNAIDETKYRDKNIEPIKIPALESAEFVVGYISNMSRREGHKYLIESIYELRQRTKRDIRGLLVGDGPERKNLESLAQELGIMNVIAFPGEIDNKQINAYYMAIDLFVIPRIPDYAADWVTPLKPYEAMALERPIIVTDLPALNEIVGENEERGLVAKPANVNSLTDKILNYINYPEMRRSKVENAKKWVFLNRTWSANAKSYESIYRRLIANRSSK
jgi:glycosyltransferase involved in cell wall biosynthesis